MKTSVSQQTGFAHLTDLPCITLQYGSASAVISFYGAQVLSYQPEPGKELLWLSPKAQWHNQSAIRGGVPICWPWFGSASTTFNPQQIRLSNHGLVRNRLWQLIQQQNSSSGVSVTLQIVVDDLPHHTGPATLQFCLTLNDSLSMALSCSNVLAQQAALHSYFSVRDINSVLIRPLPTRYYDKLRDETMHDARASSDINAETDRIYPDSARQLRIDNINADISLQQTGHDATVVWNPWIDKSQQTADLTSDSYQQFVCVETARLATSPQALALCQHIKSI